MAEQWAKAYEIFCKCFPEFELPYQIFCNLLNHQTAKLLTVCEADETAGFSVVFQNKIRMLCVHPSYQNKGIGQALLKRSEKDIQADGYHTVILGGTDAPLFMGAVTDAADYAKMQNPYFEKHGYHADGGCIEMKLALKDFELSKLTIPMPADIRFCYYRDNDRTLLYDAVAAVREDWVTYFVNAGYILAAYREETLVSFAILDFDCENLLSKAGSKVGSIGCVGTIPAGREGGIGIALVALATEELKKHHCTDCLIHWTHLETWYGKLGYRTFLRYWFGEKRLF